MITEGPFNLWDFHPGLTNPDMGSNLLLTANSSPYSKSTAHVLQPIPSVSTQAMLIGLKAHENMVKITPRAFDGQVCAAG
jgi:hypothetical protein